MSLRVRPQAILQAPARYCAASIRDFARAAPDVPSRQFQHAHARQKLPENPAPHTPAWAIYGHAAYCPFALSPTGSRYDDRQPEQVADCEAKRMDLSVLRDIYEQICVAFVHAVGLAAPFPNHGFREQLVRLIDRRLIVAWR